jgi:hypothetical protein
VAIDAIGTSTAGSAPTEVNATVPVSGTVTATVYRIHDNYIHRSNNDIQYAQSSQVNPYASHKQCYTCARTMNGSIDERWRIADDARNLYASAIRSKLSFS